MVPTKELINAIYATNWSEHNELDPWQNSKYRSIFYDLVVRVRYPKYRIVEETHRRADTHRFVYQSIWMLTAAA